MTSQPSTLIVERSHDRTVVTLHRPAARNAITAEMIDELHGICADLERDPQPLILTGAAGSFAGGADIGQLRERGWAQALTGINRRLFDRVAGLPAPTVAAVEGPALGGGAELALACDLRVASRSHRLGNPEPGLGIIAAAGACWRLSELVGRSVAKQVLLGGRVLDADAAYMYGLVSEVVDDGEALSAAHRVVDRMLRNSALALRMTKLVVDAQGPHPIADDLAQAILFESDDKYERMTAFLERTAQ